MNAPEQNTSDRGSSGRRRPADLPVEIERKFLVRRLPPGLETCPAVEIQLGYFPHPSAACRVRLRRTEARRLLTVKQGDGLKRVEVEVGLTAEQFAALWPLTAGRRLRKTRYLVPAGAATVEVDLYHGVHAGLRVAEVEFESSEAAAAFAPPGWLGADVTSVPRYSNYSLAADGDRG